MSTRLLAPLAGQPRRRPARASVHLSAPHGPCRVYASYEFSTTHPFLSLLPFSHRLLIIASSCFICFISSTHHFAIPIIQHSALSPRFSSLSYPPCCIFLLLAHSPIAGFSVLLRTPPTPRSSEADSTLPLSLRCVLILMIMLSVL